MDSEKGLDAHVGYSRLSDDHDRRRYSITRESTAGATGGVFGSVCNLSNAILGAGMLGLPFAFAQSGWFLSLFLLIVSAAMATFTLHLLSVSSQQIVTHGEASFYILAKQAMPSAAWVVEAAVILQCFGLGCAYLVVFGQLMPLVIGSQAPNPVSSDYFWVTMGLVFVTPMAFSPTLDKLRFTSALGMAAVIFLASMVYYFYLGTPSDICGDEDDGPHCGGDVKAIILDISILETISVITFSFTCHVQLLSVANEVQNYTQSKMDLICSIAVGLCAFLYCSVGYMGYLDYGSRVKDDLLASYPSDPVVSVARAGISILVGVSYPLMCKPCRDSVLSLMENSGSDDLKDFAVSNKAFYIITVGFLASTYVIAMITVNLSSVFGIMLSLIGAVCSTTIAYIIPCSVYIKLNPHPHIKKSLAIVIGIIGALLMPLCIVATFL